MNKFRKLLGRISAKTCIKMDYFGSNSQKLPSAGGSASRPPSLRRPFRTLENVQAPTSIEQFWLMQMIGNLEQNETYILYFLSPSLFKKRFHAAAASKYFQVNAFPVWYFSSLWVLFRLMQIKKESYAVTLRRSLSQYLSFFATIVS